MYAEILFDRIYKKLLLSPSERLMAKITLKDVWGIKSFERYAREHPAPSPAFDAKLLELFDRFGIIDQLDNSMDSKQRKKIKPEAWFFIRDEILPVINPHNKRDAYFLCNALTHFDTRGVYKNDDFQFLLFEVDQGLYRGLAAYTFREVHKRFVGTPLGDFCEFAITANHNRTDLVFSFSG